MIVWSDRDDDDGGPEQPPGNTGVLVLFAAVALALVAFGALLALAHW